MDTKEIRDIVSRFHAAIVNRGVRVDKILLFGSVVSKRHTEDSDLDLAVISGDFGRDRGSAKGKC
ncbi:MAG: nucleotidyltransferase domain-containing protein [Pseudomonadota bacterium]